LNLKHGNFLRHIAKHKGEGEERGKRQAAQRKGQRRQRAKDNWWQARNKAS
jgi:hypothetical protein